MRIKNFKRAKSKAAFSTIALVLGTLSSTAPAETEIANVPLFSASAVKPNIMFLMDDSDSMKRSWLPDFASTWFPRVKERAGALLSTPDGAAAPHLAYYPPSDATKPHFIIYGHYSSQCNYLAFDPSITYLPPLDDNGDQMAEASTAEFTDPNYNPFYFSYSGTVTKMSFQYKVGSDNKESLEQNEFYKQCNTEFGNTEPIDKPGAKVFQLVPVRLQNDEQKKNFQNWKLYYGTRRSMVKTAVKQVFGRLNDNYRVGFSVTSSKEADAGPKFVNIDDFKTAQKIKFYTAVGNSDGNADTPLRGSLAKAGQYFANKAPNQKVDPIQQSCQRNFTILATDGAWTKSGEETKKFGAYGVSNPMTFPDIGQRDTGSGVLPPFRDAGGDGLATLADVTAYYYDTPLRSQALGNCKVTSAQGKPVDVCTQNVPGESSLDPRKSFGDAAPWQHMTTMAIGLGVSGRLAYRADYRTASSGDFYEIANGNRNWPSIADPGSTRDFLPYTHVDDLWHAAVNGRGQYFNAGNPVTLIRSLSEALDFVNASLGAAAAASTSTSRPVIGDSDAFVASYVSRKWIGEVQKFEVDTKTGALSAKPKWSARKQLDDRTSANPRNILYHSAKAKELRPFDLTNLTADNHLANYFSGFCQKPSASGSGRPDQCVLLSPSEKTDADTGSNLVSYLKGSKGLSYYRTRESILGDITDAALLYVGLPDFPYPDTSYQTTFKKSTENRAKIVLAGANDGMLHAFDRASGEELWAFIPTLALPNLYKLADTNYANNHTSFVNATPVMADIQVAGVWKTIVVGGMGAGGRGYYALDITNTAAPKILWEYDNPQLGLTYGNPIITKRKNGTWVVAFASGYNNADGKGRLFMLNADTGVLESGFPLDTGVGAPSQPSGLAKINAWVDSETNNTALRFYGGEMLGNLWRFDTDGRTVHKNSAFKLATLTTPDGKTPQPITTKPTLAEIKYNNLSYPMVYVATGRYLGLGDLNDNTIQSIYAMKDPLTATGWGEVRKNLNDFVIQTITTGGSDEAPTRTLSTLPVDLSVKAGWRVDLPVGGERVYVNPVIAVQALYVAVNAPAPYTCQYGGSSYLYEFDIATGKGSASYEGDTLIQGLSVVQLTDGPNKGAAEPVITDSRGNVKVKDKPAPPFSLRLKRSSWRELN